MQDRHLCWPPYFFLVLTLLIVELPQLTLTALLPLSRGCALHGRLSSLI